MAKPLATDEFMRRNGRSMWVAAGAKGERSEAIKAALHSKDDSNEEKTEDDE